MRADPGDYIRRTGWRENWLPITIVALLFIALTVLGLYACWTMNGVTW